ncbi:hypothetical protein [Planktomarina sp.]|uniref:hypothetical protein n=1 Tax=Planktomarina sp. TaxID=2024851 RepID=UPI0032605E98
MTTKIESQHLSLERVYSLREIKKVLTDPLVFRFMSDELEVTEYIPNLDDIYYRVGKGLMIYERKGVCAEMHAALLGDVGEGFITQIKEQWSDLKSMGFAKVYTIHDKTHRRASMLCASAGMRKIHDENFGIFEVNL